MSGERVDAACRTCGKTFNQALNEGTSGDWIFHWGTASSTTLEAETCGENCADEYERSMGR